MGSQLLQNTEINMVGHGNFEENMDLSHIYLAVLRWLRFATPYFYFGGNQKCFAIVGFYQKNEIIMNIIA